ncbi:hypothetical protein QJS66_08855 [Kocuria rhizophila]|nr:hypothetical protein QJS66_08855 [Kocuria rhizophila]
MIGERRGADRRGPAGHRARTARYRQTTGPAPLRGSRVVPGPSGDRALVLFRRQLSAGSPPSPRWGRLRPAAAPALEGHAAGHPGRSRHAGGDGDWRTTVPGRACGRRARVHGRPRRGTSARARPPGEGDERRATSARTVTPTLLLAGRVRRSCRAMVAVLCCSWCVAFCGFLAARRSHARDPASSSSNPTPGPRWRAPMVSPRGAQGASALGAGASREDGSSVARRSGAPARTGRDVIKL